MSNRIERQTVVNGEEVTSAPDLWALGSPQFQRRRAAEFPPPPPTFRGISCLTANPERAPVVPRISRPVFLKYFSRWDENAKLLLPEGFSDGIVMQIQMNRQGIGFTPSENQCFWTFPTNN